MNKTLKIKNIDPRIKGDVVNSLFNRGIIKTKNINRDGKVPFVINGKIGMCKISGEIQIIHVKDGLLIKAEGNNGLTVGGIFLTIFLIFTLIGIIILLLLYFLEGGNLSSRGSDIINGLKDEFE